MKRRSQYINCTTLKLVLHVTYIICSVLILRVCLYSYNYIFLGLLQLISGACTSTLPLQNLFCMLLISCGAYLYKEHVCTRTTVRLRVNVVNRRCLYTTVKLRNSSCMLYLIQNTFGVKKVRPSKVESYLEVNT